MNSSACKHLALLDSRRLTGANLYWDHPSAIIEVCMESADAAIISHWRQAAMGLLAACNLPDQQTIHRIYQGGAALLISSPIDTLYAMCELNEVAWAQAVHEFGIGESPDLLAEIRRLQDLFTAERNPGLIALQEATRQHQLPFQWDDDEASMGYGAGCRNWPIVSLPQPAQIRWPELRSIPLALVTGTNGKSTTVRMVAAVLRAAGLRGGMTSTDFIQVGDETIATGDYSGNGGARILLRHPGVEAAVLEVARGGLLRRGLAVQRADAALITNVAADHLGEYGINTLAELTEAKFIVHRALDETAPLILNAEDSGIVAHEVALRTQRKGTTWWFSLGPNNPQIEAHVQQGLGACWLQQDTLWTNAALNAAQRQPRPLCTVTEITASRAGLLQYNVQNAMGAALLGLALGLSDQVIIKGLAEFRGDEQDNPGRGNWFEHQGIHIVVDFAHNEHGLRALGDAVKTLKSKRIVVVLGQAGDRSDTAIRDMTAAALSMQPERLLIYQLPGYERGRDIAEPPALIRAAAQQAGMQSDRLIMHMNPLEAARDALAHARSGDVLVLLALIQRREILQLVHEFMQSECR